MSTPLTEQTDRSSPPVAGIIGLGLIGGSAALALRDLGYTICGVDAEEARAKDALERGVIDHIGLLQEAVLTVVATPVDAVPEAVEKALESTVGWVTDTGSVKGPIAQAISSERFVPSHPMAGSEQTGLDGARAELFRGAAWVICPTESSSDDAFAELRRLIIAFGADPLTVAPDVHDRLVATVSHVPHLAAATLMNVATARSDEHMAMLRLAAGGFRDMTRIASGSPDIWPPICIQNSAAITETLDHVIDSLATLRDAVDRADASAINEALSSARTARLNLPSSTPLPPGLSEVRVRIKDQRGELAAITSLAAELDVNIFDLEIAHSAEGPTGVIVLLVDTEVGELFKGGLLARGYRPSVRELS